MNKMKKQIRPSWDQYFMEIAHVAKRIIMPASPHMILLLPSWSFCWSPPEDMIESPPISTIATPVNPPMINISPKNALNTLARALPGLSGLRNPTTHRVGSSCVFSPAAYAVGTSNDINLLIMMLMLVLA